MTDVWKDPEYPVICELGISISMHEQASEQGKLMLTNCSLDLELIDCMIDIMITWNLLTLGNTCNDLNRALEFVNIEKYL